MIPADIKKEIKRLQKYERMVQFICNDYWELSHDKVLWQRDDWKKRCAKLITNDINAPEFDMNLIEYEEQNAMITSVSMMDSEHGSLSAFVHLEFAHGTQGFGGYPLYNPSALKNQPNYAGHFIWRVMEVAGVSAWEKAPGNPCRVRLHKGQIVAIGHIIKDIWFDPKEEFERLREEFKKDNRGPNNDSF